MPFSLTPALVEPAVAGWLGAIDVDGGATSEQLRVLRAIVAHVLGRADLDLGARVGLQWGWQPCAAAARLGRAETERLVGRHFAGRRVPASLDTLTG